MNILKFSLNPFREKGPVPDIEIAGSIGRRVNTLSIGYTLRGDLLDLAIPVPVDVPERKDRLWDNTCLEFFLGIRGSLNYWEFNLSPAGHWNVYRFASFREGMREEPSIASLPFEVWTAPGALRLELDLEIASIIPAARAVDVAVCAVVKTRTGAVSHWALVHPGPRPDFHRRDGFLLALPATRGDRRAISTSSDRS